MKRISIYQSVQMLIGGINMFLLSVFFVFLYYWQFRLCITQKEIEAIISILLTCLGVILTGIAIFFTILGVFGYNSIKDMAEKAIAEATAKATEAIEAATREAVENAERVFLDQLKLLSPKMDALIDQKMKEHKREFNDADDLINRIFTPEALKRFKGKKDK